MTKNDAGSVPMGEAGVRELTKERDELDRCLDHYQARFTALHDAYMTGDNASALDALRRHVTADDEAGTNKVLRERDEAIAKNESLRRERDAALAEVERLRFALKRMIDTETWAGKIKICGHCSSVVGRSTVLIAMAKDALEKR